MNKTAKELWAEAGYPFIKEDKKSVVYSDNKDFIDRDESLGVTEILICKDGLFEGKWIKAFGNEKESESITFNQKMTDALIQQFKEFGII